MIPVSDILYLHGFASGPNSTKGRYFADRFGSLGIRVHRPDLAEGAFRELTLTRQLEVIRRVAVETKPGLLMGSSLGGYLAALYAAQSPPCVRALVLMAPAFGFPKRWADKLGPEQMEHWRQAGEMDVFHYGEGGLRPIAYRFYEDALRYDPFPSVEQPALIFHGRSDETVPVGESERFAAGRQNVRLRLLDSDHALTGVTELMWEETLAFCRSRSCL